MNNSYQKLLARVAEIISGSRNDFNIFDMLGQNTRELTHSAFIAQLLNPRGGHGMNTCFLELFIETLNNNTRGYGHLNFDFDGIEVEIEKDFGVKQGKGVEAVGGRIDIYLKNKKGEVIVIENKIYATDQEDQLQRYRNSTGEDSHIFYLTLDGHTPRNTPNNVGYRIISYKDEILNWLTKCREKSAKCQNLYSVISQYMSTVENLTIDQEVRNRIEESSSNIRAALHIACLADKSRNHLKRKFLEELATKLGLENPVIKSDGKELVLITDVVDWCVEWNLFFRVHSEGTEQSKNWEYIYYPTNPKATINLHEFNEPASVWLDDNEHFWSTLLPIISQIQLQPDKAL